MYAYIYVYILTKVVDSVWPALLSVAVACGNRCAGSCNRKHHCLGA